jgi:hypothetical protein
MLNVYNIFLPVLLVLISSLCSAKDEHLSKAGDNIKARRVLVVAGNFSIDGELVNIAQYDIATKE